MSGNPLLVDDAVRREKEAFVTGLQGTSSWEVLALGLLVPLSFAVHQAAQRRWKGGGGWLLQGGLFGLCVLTPLTLSLTVAADRLSVLAAVEVAVLLALLGSDGLRPPPSSDGSTAFLSLYRVSLLLSTAVAILAVDFSIFPRRLAKTEEFGLSPVGRSALPPHSLLPPPLSAATDCSRPLCGAADGRRCRRLHLLRCPHLLPGPPRSPPPPSSAASPLSCALSEAAQSLLTSSPSACGCSAEGRPSSVASSSSSSLSSLLRRCVPLVVLGLVRWLSVWSSGYQSHVTEYGVHWNFFFTLAAVSLLSSLLFHAGLRVRHCSPLAVVLLCGHQAALSLLGLTAFVLHGPRRRWWEQNREGLTSVLGYLALHLIATHIGAAVHSAQRRSKVRGGEVGG